jgi:hypothetical protein
MTTAPIEALSHNTFLAATGLYVVSAACAFAPFARLRRTATALFIAALLANAASMALRWLNVWPLLPLNLGPLLLPAFMGALSLTGIFRGASVRRTRIAAAALAALAAAFFPKDFYLPFVQSNTISSHLFTLFGTAARVCFCIAAMEAAQDLAPLFRGGPLAPHRHSAIGAWLVWGFITLTVSTFSGEMWSYLGWGSPIVWEDAAVAVTMATWCYYACLLHLHLSRRWTPLHRLAFTTVGGLLVVFFMICTELGPFQWPHIQ